MRARAIVAAMGLGAMASVPALAGQAEPAIGGQQIYTYAVRHPIYGEIGTYTDTIDHGSEITRIEGSLRIAVKVLGVVAYRMASDTTEIMRENRLIWLRSATDKDGERSEVHGEARGDQFVVHGTGGSFAGPADITPTDPWMLQRIGEKTVVFTDTGRIFNVQISGGGYDSISLNGISVLARHFVVTGVRRQEVWLDNRQVPILFRIVEDGTPIDFVLRDATAQTGSKIGNR